MRVRRELPQHCTSLLVPVPYVFVGNDPRLRDCRSMPSILSLTTHSPSTAMYVGAELPRLTTSSTRISRNELCERSILCDLIIMVRQKLKVKQMAQLFHVVNMIKHVFVRNEETSCGALTLCRI
eukprot:scaffold11069_cov93-Skeletonema_marinoi.AAC.7